jgi:hypothetical protein
VTHHNHECTDKITTEGKQTEEQSLLPTEVIST